MQHRQPEQRRLYQQIADQIRQLILTDDFPVGARLPSERDLAAKLEVSRPSVREALIALEIEGMVEIRVGSGVYVTADRARSPTPIGPLGESPSELMQARMLVEGHVVLLAAGRVTTEGLKALRSSIVAMEDDVIAGRNPVAHDKMFHMTIAANCGNVVLERIVLELFDGRHTPLSEKLQARYGTPETWQMALEEHRAILNAIERNDALLAQAAMVTHLNASRRRWIEA